jgi:hypothetical protein
VITVADDAGTDVPGTTVVSDGGKLLTFEPSVPFAPSTHYTATLDYCLDDETLSFTTSDIGSPLTDPNVVVGQVYLVDLKAARFVRPEGVADILQRQLERSILLSVRAAEATSVTMRLGIAQEDSTSQDTCVPTVDFQPGSLDDASWQIGPTDVTLYVAGNLVDVGGLEASGTFSADGSSFGCGAFTGLVDTRPLNSVIGDKNSPDDYLCSLVANYGAKCVPCSDSEPLCLELEVDQVTAAATGGTLETVKEACTE